MHGRCSLLAMASPDLRGCDYWLEKEIFWLEHALLVLVPAYFIARRRFIVAPPSASLAVVSWALNAVYYCAVLTWAAIISGQNLGYMLHPPVGTLQRSAD
jgi:uncharacterized membrane protein YwaF